MEVFSFLHVRMSQFVYGHLAIPCALASTPKAFPIMQGGNNAIRTMGACDLFESNSVSD